MSAHAWAEAAKVSEYVNGATPTSVRHVLCAATISLAFRPVLATVVVGEVVVLVLVLVDVPTVVGVGVEVDAV